MINWWLIVICVVVALVTLAATTYIMIIYSSPDDRNQAWIPKGVVVLSFCLAAFAVLLLPFDVANAADPLTLASLGGGLDLALVWQICLLTIVGMVLLVIPFCIFYYEAMDPDHKCAGLAQIPAALCYALIFLIVYIGVLLIMWYLIGYTDIKYTAYSAIMLPEVIPEAYNAQCTTCQTYANQTLSIPVSIFVYAIALFTLLGWVFFVVFGGVGLSALPVDLIMSWVERPRPMTLHEYGMRKQRISAAAERLHLKGKTLEDEQRAQGNRISNALIRRINQFKLEVAFIEERYQRLEVCHKQGGGSVWLAWLWLFLGLVSICISFAWVAHIIAWNILRLNEFLNAFFIVLDGVFPLFGVIAYGCFAFYLLWASVKGVTKLGMRLLFFEVHPMKLRDTLMNAFLFNCAIILLVSTTVVHFVTQSFEAYCENTAIQSLFTTYVENLMYIGYAFKYFPYVLLAFFFLGLLFTFLCRPKRPSLDD